MTPAFQPAAARELAAANRPVPSAPKKPGEIVGFAGIVPHTSSVDSPAGPGRWRKRKGFADIRLSTGEFVRAELHWYEANGIGKFELKIKRLV